MTRTALPLLAVALFFTACGSSRPPAVAATDGGYAPPAGEPAPAEQGSFAPTGRAYAGEDAAKREAAAAPESAAGADSEVARAARPQHRPGLGTQWGETRASSVTTAAFYRAEPTRPFALATIYYNDSAGIAAMVDRGSRYDYGDNVAEPYTGFRVRVLDESHRPLPSTRAAGRNYVVGQHSQRYIIQIQNQTGNRIEAVASVDGLDVLDGDDAAYGKRGYIVAPWSTVEIDGFRRSYHSVAAFRFGSVGNSYAATKGKARNVGVIGVAFFHEAGARFPWVDQAEIDRRHSADPFPGRFATPPPGQE